MIAADIAVSLRDDRADRHCDDKAGKAEGQRVGGGGSWQSAHG
jgi:hypothetical protein